MEDKDLTFGPVELPEVTVAAVDLQKRNQYLAYSGEYYRLNPIRFREAIRFMQKHRDREGEYRIFMKCLHSEREETFRSIVLPIAGFALTLPFGGMLGAFLGASSRATFSVATKFIPHLRHVSLASQRAASSAAARSFSAMQTRGGMYMGKASSFMRAEGGMYAATSSVRTTINATTQMLIEEDGYKGLDMVSLASEWLPFKAGVFSNLVEYRPFQDKEEDRIRHAFGGDKSVFETFFDMSSATAWQGGCMVTNKLLKYNAMDRINKRRIGLTESFGYGYHKFPTSVIRHEMFKPSVEKRKREDGTNQW